MSSKFTGTYYRSLDAKGRMILPPAWHKVLKSAPGNEEMDSPVFWLTGLYGRLTAYLPEEWERTVAQLCSIKAPSQKLANFKTRLIGLGQEMVPDAQGRIRLTQPLCKAAGLSRNVVIVGLLDNFEIWDQQRFENLSEEAGDVAAELSAAGVEISL